MLRVLPANAASPIGQGLFHARRIRPGAALDHQPDDAAFGPLSAIDHATLETGAVIPMHEHRNDEILSYMWRGVMVHGDSTGNQVELSARRLMIMHAGSGIRHEESVPGEPVEMLQIFIRPEQADLPPHVEFWDREEPAGGAGWQLVAGPSGSDAPLTVRQRVMIFGAHARAGEHLNVPEQAAMKPWVYVLDGAIAIGGQQLEKGDSVLDVDEPLPPIRVVRDANLVAFLVDLTASASRAGTISGQ